MALSKKEKEERAGKLRRQKWRKKARPKLRAVHQAWYAKNREDQREKARVRRLKNIKRHKREYQKWRASLTGLFCIRINTIKCRLPNRSDCKIDFKDLFSLYKKQKGLCVVTGRKLCVKRLRRNDSISVDKINQTKGYVKGNIRLVTWQTNSARGMGTDRQLVSFCQDVLKHHKYKQRKRRK